MSAPGRFLLLRSAADDVLMDDVAASLAGGAAELETLDVDGGPAGVPDVEALVAGIARRGGVPPVVVAYGGAHHVAELIAAAGLAAAVVLIAPPERWPEPRELARRQLAWLRESIEGSEGGRIVAARPGAAMFGAAHVRAMRTRIDVPVLLVGTEGPPGPAAARFFASPVTVATADGKDWGRSIAGYLAAGGSSPVMPQ